MALYGYHPPSITYSLRDSKVQAVEYHMEHQQQVLKFLKDNLNLAQNQMNNKQINTIVNEALMLGIGCF